MDRILSQAKETKQVQANVEHMYMLHIVPNLIRPTERNPGTFNAYKGAQREFIHDVMKDTGTK